MVTSRLVLPLFFLAQACDGVFTYTAVQAYGLVAEGNLLLVTWMSLVGAGPAIVGAKLVAAGCGAVLYFLGSHRVLCALTAFYGIVVIAPWLFVLHHA